MNIAQLEEYFKSIELPDSIRLNSCTFVDDVNKMINSNLATLKSHSGNKTYMPYYSQLVELKNVLENIKEDAENLTE